MNIYPDDWAWQSASKSIEELKQQAFLCAYDAVWQAVWMKIPRHSGESDEQN
jgi:hypothetical protein